MIQTFNLKIANVVCVWWKTTQEHINSALSSKDDEMMAKSDVIRYGQVIVKSYGRFLK